MKQISLVLLLLTPKLSLSDGCRWWYSWLKIIRCYFIHLRQIPFHSLLDGASLVLKQSAALRSHRKKCMVERSFSYGFLKLFFVFTDLTNTFYDFPRGVVTKHVLKDIWGESAFNKDCKYRAATGLKRDFDTGVFLWACKFFQNSFFIEQLWTARVKFIYITKFVFSFVFSFSREHYEVSQESVLAKHN